jgi:hypothetical protein
MNEQNLVKRLSFLAPGDGYRKCAFVDLLANVKDATGLVLTAATVPAIAALETNFYGLSVAANQTHLGRIDWTVPQDYDGSADELRIRVACNMAGANASDQAASKITALIYRKRPVPSIIPDDAQGVMPAGLALSADLGATATAAGVIPLLGANLLTKWVEINADRWLDPLTKLTTNRSLSATADASIQAGDCLSIALTTAAHTTDAISVYGIELWYRSNLAFTDINAR